jgi:spectinomycin phosphotransferase
MVTPRRSWPGVPFAVVFTKPEDIDEARLVERLRDLWDLPASDLAYAPVGFGSHHWIARHGVLRWFVTVDDLGARIGGPADTHDLAYERLERALRTAQLLSEDAGLDFVVAPMLSRAGEVVHRLDPRYSLAVHPFLDGYTPDDGVAQYRSTHDRRAVLDLICELHQATAAVEDTAARDDLTIPLRDALDEAMATLDAAWDAGPYSERTRRLLARHAAALERLLAGFDVLVGRVLAEPERFVVTHGEPGALNVLVVGGRFHLIDWESARLAAPERDLWDLASGDDSALAIYETATGTQVRDHAVDAYQLWYDLFEIAGYIDLFRHPHRQTADAAEAWKNLECFLQPAERWPQFT